VHFIDTLIYRVKKQLQDKNNIELGWSVVTHWSHSGKDEQKVNTTTTIATEYLQAPRITKVN